LATKTLYVGNLPYTITEGDLLSHFSKYNATRVRIVEGRGFGFVDIDADQLATAVADNDQKDLNGRTLTVGEARPKGDSSDRSGGSSYRRGNASY